MIAHERSASNTVGADRLATRHAKTYFGGHNKLDTLPFSLLIQPLAVIRNKASILMINLSHFV